ncbi:tyrosine-type recombinase/integrase [Mycolicibacterium hippocampi]|uniref:tyrosine-type recombinase/integrase n=1 Tax=Mycolicibacterium hippocampi TaxID=659824 RepID=UPI0035150E5F
MNRQQLPPQIKKLTVVDRSTGKPVVRYQVTADAGTNPTTGKRHQVRRRFTTEREARDALAAIANDAAHGRFVPRATSTVEDVCAAYIASRRRLRESSLAKLEYDLAPVREMYGHLAVQRLSKAHIDGLVGELVVGGTVTSKGRVRKPWSPSSVNKVISTIDQVLQDAARQGIVPRNVAELVDRVPLDDGEVDTYSEAEVRGILSSIGDDRLQHAWLLALSGLRRGEIAGLRWAQIDLDGATLSVRSNRVKAGGKTVENAPKSKASRRSLPIPTDLVAALRKARARQAAERLALGGGAFEYVVCNEAGEPYNPDVLSRYWAQRVKQAGFRHIKLHGARHTCATLMHLQNVPTAVIAAWVGHKDATLTMRLYVHSQDEALKSAGESLNRLVTFSDTEVECSNDSNTIHTGQGGADDGNRTRVFSLGS